MEEKKNNTKDDFRALAKDMDPVIEQIRNILANHGIPGTATLSVDKDGYFYFSHYGTDLEFKSIGTGMTKYISLNITEEF